MENLITNLNAKAAKALKKPAVLGDYDKSFFKKYPQFVNIRFCIANFGNLTGDNCITQYIHYMRSLNQAGFSKNESYINESIRFIAGFCKSHNIKIDDYGDFRETNKVLESFWIHLKDRNVSSYALIFFPKCVQKILTSDREDAKYYMEDISEFSNKISEVNSNLKLKQKIINKLKQLKI